MVLLQKERDESKEGQLNSCHVAQESHLKVTLPGKATFGSSEKAVTSAHD